MLTYDSIQYTLLASWRQPLFIGLVTDMFIRNIASYVYTAHSSSYTA